MLRTLKNASMMTPLIALSAWLVFAAPVAAQAQNLSPAALATGTAAQGFSSQTLVAELAILLPEEAIRPEQGGQAGRGGGAPGTNTRAQFQFARDPKQFLTKAQAAKLLPVLESLRDNPMPSPSKAKRITADVDAILSAAQKAEFGRFQKVMETFRKDIQKQRAASAASGGAGTSRGGAAAGGAGAGGAGVDRGGATEGGSPQAGAPVQGAGAGDFRNMNDEQRRAFIANLPPDQRQRMQERLQGAGAGGQMSQLQRRQRQVEAFVKALRDYAKL